MAVLGSIVTYGISAADEVAIRHRASLAQQSPGHSHPVAGDELPALVTKHYGGDPGAEVVDLVVQLNGVGRYWVGGVAQSAEGEQGSWW
jgi:hypothetical protein